MGTIVTRKRVNGATSYMAQIMLKREGIIHRETKTFDRRAAAAAWLERRERELKQPGGIARAKAADPTLAMAIDRYTEDQRHIGRTKAQVLKAIKGYPISEMKCSEIKSHDVVELARTLAEGRTPQTVQNYLSHLSAVFSLARSAWGYELDREAMKDAFSAARRLGMTGKSKKRDRRPTTEEIEKLLAHFGEIKRRRPASLPMCQIIAFALYSTRRQEEITRIAWADYEPGASRVLVRDMKHPGEKIGNDVRCDLPKEAMAIIDAMPKTDARIFPFSTDAIGAAFTRACQFLKIEDLHFHDLRHEGVSRLFEMGLDIPHVAAVSGHRSWVSLKRYTHLRHNGDRWEKCAAMAAVVGGGE